MSANLNEPFSIDAREDGKVLVVRIHGSAGMGEAEELQAKLDELVATEVPRIVIDLSGMNFISSSGLGALIAAHLRSRKHGQQVRLVNPQKAVLDVLETTRLTKLFDIYSSLDQALKD